MNNSTSLSITDALALERTKLANERTLLAYFRTSIVLFSTGGAMIRLELLENIYDLGLVLVCLSPVVLLLGIVRYKQFDKKMKKIKEAGL